MCECLMLFAQNAHTVSETNDFMVIGFRERAISNSEHPQETESETPSNRYSLIYSRSFNRFRDVSCEWRVDGN